MKSERGITLATLMIYVMFVTATLVLLANLTNYMYGNFSKIGLDSISSEEFNKFNTNFVADIKSNTDAKVSTIGNDVTIILSDGTNYNYIASEKAIYRNKQKISKNITDFSAEYVNNDATNNKNVIKIKIGTGKGNDEANFGKTINYVLKYW